GVHALLNFYDLTATIPWVHPVSQRKSFSRIRHSPEFLFPSVTPLPQRICSSFPYHPRLMPGVNPTLPLQSETGRGRVGCTIFPSLLLITSIPCFIKSFVSPKGTPPPKAVG